MHIYTNKNFDAKVATARFDVTAMNGAKRDGFGVKGIYSFRALRHLIAMLRHHSAISHPGGSAPYAGNGKTVVAYTNDAECMQESGNDKRPESLCKQAKGGLWQSQTAISSRQTTPNSGLPAGTLCPSLVTT